MIVIQSALHFPDVGDCLTYPERMRKTNEKFSTGKGLLSGFSEIQVSETLRDLPLCVGF